MRQPVDGACHRVGPQATAYAYRDATLAVALGGSWPDPADDGANIAWSRRYYDAARLFGMGGGYVNFGADDDPGQARPGQPVPPNQNIPPARSGG